MNEAEPTTRLRLHVSTAVQGELFPATGTQPVTRGYKGTVASKVAGITYRQLDYWASQTNRGTLHHAVAWIRFAQAVLVQGRGDPCCVEKTA